MADEVPEQSPPSSIAVSDMGSATAGGKTARFAFIPVVIEQEDGDTIYALLGGEITNSGASMGLALRRDAVMFGDLTLPANLPATGDPVSVAAALYRHLTTIVGQAAGVDELRAFLEETGDLLSGDDPVSTAIRVIAELAQHVRDLQRQQSAPQPERPTITGYDAILESARALDRAQRMADQAAADPVRGAALMVEIAKGWHAVSDLATSRNTLRPPDEAKTR